MRRELTREKKHGPQPRLLFFQVCFFLLTHFSFSFLCRAHLWLEKSFEFYAAYALYIRSLVCALFLCRFFLKLKMRNPRVLRLSFYYRNFFLNIYAVCNKGKVLILKKSDWNLNENETKAFLAFQSVCPSVIPWIK